MTENWKVKRAIGLRNFCMERAIYELQLKKLLELKWLIMSTYDWLKSIYKEKLSDLRGRQHHFSRQGLHYHGWREPWLCRGLRERKPDATCCVRHRPVLTESGQEQTGERAGSDQSGHLTPPTCWLSSPPILVRSHPTIFISPKLLIPPANGGLGEYT